MNSEVISELQKIRNQIAHGIQSAEPASLARRLAELGLSIPTADIPKLTQTILAVFRSPAGFSHVPPLLLQALSTLLDGTSARVVCDPWAGLGELLSAVREFTHAPKVLAFTQNESEFTLGRTLVCEGKWELGAPLALLESLKTELDLVVSILPFGAKSDRSITLVRTDGTPVELQDDLGNLILAAAAVRLSEQGLGLFVIPPSFFFSQRSVLHHFTALGVGVEAALALPFGSFAPYTNMPTYLVAVRKRKIPRMFVAQLSGDAHTNAQIVTNLKDGKEGGRLELGRFVDPLSFRGLASIRVADRLDHAGSQFGAPAARLGELATVINLGRFGDDFKFPQLQNALFIPLIGASDGAKAESW